MVLGRPWLFRASVAGNLLLLTYVALYSSSSSQDTPTLRSLDSPSLTSDPNTNKRSGQESLLLVQVQEPFPQSSGGGNTLNSPEESGKVVAVDNKGPDGVVWDGDDSALGEGIAADLVSPPQPQQPDIKDPLLEIQVNDTTPTKDKLFPCDDLTSRPFYGQRGSYWVLYNFIRAERTFRCDQSITYTTHADFTFLDNLVPLLERWQGPLSLSVYAPGTDFAETLQRIAYLRECAVGAHLVKDFVTFHIFFDNRHVPKSKVPAEFLKGPQAYDALMNLNCSALQAPAFGDLPTYKKQRKLPYPVNVARNVARDMATTHYILPSDIELYPNPNLIPDFLEMIRLNDSALQRPNPKVFVLSIFEVEANVSRMPMDKRELIKMLGDKSAIPFHKYVCADCHRIPKAGEWMNETYREGLKVFHVGKRHKPFHHWEPIFIGTKFDPMYDERLSWEGRSDKMTQGFLLCVLDYEFHILDNAFLVHKPGIKRNKVIPKKNPAVAKQNSVIAKVILPELRQVYGTRPGCFV